LTEDEPIVRTLANVASGDIGRWELTTEPGYQHGYWGMALGRTVETSQQLLEIRALRASIEIYGAGITARTQPRDVALDRFESGERNASERLQQYQKEVEAYRRGLRDYNALRDDALRALAKRTLDPRDRAARRALIFSRYLHNDPPSSEADLASLPVQEEDDDALGFLTHIDSTERALLTAVKLLSELLDENDHLTFKTLIGEVRGRRLAPDNWLDRHQALRRVFALWSVTVNLEKEAVTLVEISKNDDQVAKMACEEWSTKVSFIAPTERRMSVLWSERFAALEC
jgi:hypothetical protein